MSMENKQTLSDMVFDIKEKITDDEYKNIMEKIGDEYVKIHFKKFEATVESAHSEDDESVAKLKMSQGSMILKVETGKNEVGDDFCINYNMFHRCVLPARWLLRWKQNPDMFPVSIQLEADTIMLVDKFEEM